MPDVLVRLLLAVAAGLAVVWAALLLVLWRANPGGTGLRESLRLLPDLVRLLRALAGDRALPRRMRIGLWTLLGYLASPIDLVPDIVPVLGYADDAILVVLTLRWAVRTAGPEALARHWPGTPEGLAALERLAIPR